MMDKVAPFLRLTKFLNIPIIVEPEVSVSIKKKPQKKFTKEQKFVLRELNAGLTSEYCCLRIDVGIIREQLRAFGE